MDEYIVKGKNKQINCKQEDYYKFIGYLANPESDVEIVLENNDVQGAWGKEARIRFKNDKAKIIFESLGIKFTAGGNGCVCRLNCNEFYEELLKLGFTAGKKQNIEIIKNNIPKKFLKSFEEGLNL